MEKMWSDELILFIIDKVRDNPFVWNPNHPAYKNKARKNIFWSEVVKELRAKQNNNPKIDYCKFFFFF